MSIGHLDNVRPFQPKGTGGGSKKGKPQGYWPWVMKIAADAVLIRVKGSIDAWLKDRNRHMTEKQFGQAMDQILPGWRTWCHENLGSRATSYERLLINRVYKMYYSGTSDNKEEHDPANRATMSGEHWLEYFTTDSEFGVLHEKIVRLGLCIPDWKKYLNK